jgi:PD-(D/E)XK endonuclease
MAESGYVGKAGQLAVMAELLLRGYNVAMPEVDVGDDVFVVHDRQGTLWRVQVKTAIGKRREYGYSGKFAVNRTQLETKKRRDLFFVLALRAGPQWDYLILPRRELLRAAEQGLASAAGDNSIFTFRFGPAQVLCGTRDFQARRNNWSEWPITPTP